MAMGNFFRLIQLFYAVYSKANKILGDRLSFYFFNKMIVVLRVHEIPIQIKD